jgi:glutathione peroxidase
MKNRILSVILTSVLFFGGNLMAQSFYDFTLNDIDGKPVSLGTYEGKVLLAVNVASKCGFTKQYAGLEELYKTYRDSGLVILGFPANNFMSQEPGTDAEIKQFCTLNYNVTFPMFSKISVKGKDQAPLYAWLTSQETGPEGPGGITWNFNKYLVNRRGEAVYRFGSKTEPGSEELVGAVKKLLAEPVPQGK